MKLLWLELNKLARQGLRIAAGLLLVLAVLNIGVGGAVALSHPYGAPVLTGNADGAELLHLQLFGFYHIHNGAIPGHSHQSDAPAGVTEVELPGDFPADSGHAFTVGFASPSGPALNNGVYGPGWVQKLLSEYQTADYSAFSWENQVVIAPNFDKADRPSPFIAVPTPPPIR